MPGGRIWVSGGETIGPPWSWIRLSRLRAYSRAWRTITLFSALLLLGDWVLKMMYGLLAYSLKSDRPGLLEESKPGMALVGTEVSHIMSAWGVLVINCCRMPAWVPVSVMSISLT